MDSLPRGIVEQHIPGSTRHCLCSSFQHRSGRYQRSAASRMKVTTPALLLGALGRSNVHIAAADIARRHATSTARNVASVATGLADMEERVEEAWHKRLS